VKQQPRKRGVKDSKSSARHAAGAVVAAGALRWLRRSRPHRRRLRWSAVLGSIHN